MIWHSEKKEDVAEKLQSQPKHGLTDMLAALRLEEYGGNVRVKLRKRSGFVMLMGRLFAPFSLILMLFSGIWIAVNVIDCINSDENPLLDSDIRYPALLLLVTVIFAVVRTARQFAVNKNILGIRSRASYSKVRRGSVIKKVPSKELVPGDVVQIEAGDVIPADGRLLITASFMCDEGLFTGSRRPVLKDSDAVLDKDTPLKNRVNMAYSGTVAVSGRALMMVTETGMNTEHAKLRSVKPKKVNARTRIVRSFYRTRTAGIIIALCVSLASAVLVALRTNISDLPKSLHEIWTFIVMSANNMDRTDIYTLYMLETYPYNPTFLSNVLDWLVFTILLAVCAIPIGLPQNAMHLLSEGVRSLRHGGTMLHRFSKAELIGGTTVICADKTGTLTLNEMKVSKAWPLGDSVAVVDEGFWSDEMKYLMKCSALCCDSKVLYDYEGNPVITGDQTETAIISAFVDNGNDMDELMEQYPRRAIIPFDSSRKLMTVIHQVNGLYIVVTKGAPDVLASKCIDVDMDEINAHNSEFCSEGLRVIAVAVHALNKLPEKITPENIENELTFIGLIGLDDPCREDVRKCVRECSEAGIRTVMMTGDHPETASAVAVRLGIMEDGDTVLTGDKLANMSDERLSHDIYRYSVFARISPEDKIRLIRTWQSKGDCVLIASGGMGDAPALKAADISCAVEATAADVAIHAADVTLSENNFRNIRSLIEKGRAIRRNLARLSEYSVACCVAQGAALVAGRLIFGVNVFNIMPMLLLNLMLFIFVQPFFADEPAEKDVMRDIPYLNDGRVMGFLGRARALLSGGYIAFNSLLLYWLCVKDFGDYGFMMRKEGAGVVFIFMTMSLVLYALCVRSDKPFLCTAIVRNQGLLFGSLVVASTALCVYMYQTSLAVFGFYSFIRMTGQILFLLGLEFFVWQYPKFHSYFKY